jgi:hypothetical protein
VTATPEDVHLPARRRRHARLIAALTELIGACASAAAAVYRPIADSPPGQQAAEAEPLQCIEVSARAPVLLDRARDEDAARWPAATQREQAEAEQTLAARCAVALAEEAVEPAAAPGEDGVPVPTAEQSAALGLVDAGSEVAALWRDDPRRAAALLSALAASGEFTAAEILDEAADTVALTGLLVLREVPRATDPNTAARLCLSAVPHFALAATLAGADPG